MYKKNTIILTPFPFTDLSDYKIRPAVILSSQNLNSSDVIVAFISSRTNKNKNIFDISIKKDSQNNLKTNSILKISKIATLDKKIILGELGNLSEQDAKKVDKKLKKLFSL